MVLQAAYRAHPAVGRMMALAGVHVLLPQTRGYVTSYSRGTVQM